MDSGWWLLEHMVSGRQIWEPATSLSPAAAAGRPSYAWWRLSSAHQSFADRSGSRTGSDHPCTARGGRTENYRERWRVSAIVIQDPESNCPGVRSTWITLFRPRREWFPQWRANRKRSGLPSDCTEPSV